MRTALIPLLLSCATSLFAQDRVEKLFYPDGTISSVYVALDERSWFVTYHENGRVKEKGGFYSGKLNGTWKQFDDQGNLLTRARFVDGRREGNWKFGNTEGEITLRLRYRDNELVHGVQFDPNGELVAERGLK